MILRNSGVRTRLAMGFGVMVALLGIVSFAALFQISRIDEAQARQGQMEQLRRQVVQWNSLTQLNVARTLTLARAGSPPVLAKWLDGEMKQTSASISELQKGIEAKLAQPREKELLGQVAKARQGYVELRASLLRRLADPAQAGAATADIDTGLLPAAQAYLGALDNVRAQVDQEFTAQERLRADSVATAQMVLPALALAGLVLAVLFAWRVGGAIARALRDAAAVARRIAGGDLTRPVAVTDAGELGELQAGLAQMQEGLREVVSGIRTGTESLHVASTQIASGNQDLSARTESAAASLEQTSASMKELARAIEQAAGSADQASALATQAVDVARRGREVVANVVDTMAGIDADSKRIADITGVIDGIAFQTNILALNAAVEAARAGEQGRGFAVVAGEVRALAGRSAQAAQQIKALVEASTRQVRTGTQLAQSAGGTMQDIEQSVQQFSHAFGGIREAAAGQANGVGEVSSAVTRLDEITQQNAALVEESAAAAQTLRHQADALASAVQVFKLAPT